MEISPQFFRFRNKDTHKVKLWMTFFLVIYSSCGMQAQKKNRHKDQTSGLQSVAVYRTEFEAGKEIPRRNKKNVLKNKKMTSALPAGICLFRVNSKGESKPVKAKRNN